MAVVIVLAPLVAMQFTREVDWTIGDFLFAVVLIGGTGLLYELAVRASTRWSYRGAVALALAAGFLTIWINLAVGIIGNEDNPANSVFFGVIAIAVAGTIVAGGRAALMSRAMTVTAAGQGLVGLSVFTTGMAASEAPGRAGLFVLIEAFALLWLGSALLFRTADRAAE